MTADQWKADVLVVGGGPAGSIMARCVANNGRQVILVDPLRLSHDRLEVLSPAALPIIRYLQLECFLEDREIARPCLGIRRKWFSNEFQFDDFIRSPGGQGFVIDRKSFDSMLRTAAIRAGAILYVGRARGARRVAEGMCTTLYGGGRRICVHANVLIDATGRPACMARRLGAKRIACDRQVATRRDVSPQDGNVGDPVWLNVVNEGKRTWSYRVDGPKGRAEHWEVGTGNGLNTLTPAEAVDASSAYLSPAAGAGWIAIGDAAAAFDPITSQGLGHALGTAAFVAELITSPTDDWLTAARAYSIANGATFANTEIQRQRIYADGAKIA